MSDFKSLADENHFPFDEEAVGGWGVYRAVPLDGTMRGKRLRLHFYSSGGLQWAGIVNADGDVEALLLAID